MAELTKEDYEVLKQYVSVDVEPIGPEEMEVVRIIFTDNLVGRSQMTWDVEALKSMVELLPGCPFTVDHNWGEVDESIGVILSAEIYSSKSAPAKMIGRRFTDLNKGILKKDGWLPVVGRVAIDKKSDTLRQLRMGSIGKVSIGGFRTTAIWCPICATSFNDKHCPHYAPSPWYDEDPNKTAPYIIRKNVDDMGECSFVLIPNAPSAGVITRDIASYFD